jgi:hypothetical protein
MAKKASERATGKRTGRKTIGGEASVTVKLPVTTKGIYVVDVSKKKPKVQLF